MTKQLIVVLALCCGIIACGQKGPLYHPPADQEAPTAPDEQQQ
ncbi:MULTISPECIES: LPS translocon maturation chaperone LptM [Aliagarivorans]|nr:MULTISPECIES: lipoprotein [Aliagarivorans]